MSMTILRFTEEEAEVRKKALPFVLSRYIRTFDVISEVICVLLTRKRRIENIVLFLNFDVISKVKYVSLRRRPMFKKSAPMWPSTLYLKLWSVFRA